MENNDSNPCECNNGEHIPCKAKIPFWTTERGGKRVLSETPCLRCADDDDGDGCFCGWCLDELLFGAEYDDE